MSVYTQVDFDADILTVANAAVDRMVIIAALRRQGDPSARKLEEQQMMLLNCLYALRDYDVTSEVLSDDDIALNFEFCQSILQINS